MGRPITALVVFFIAFNLFASMLMSTGVAAALGLDATVGGNEEINDRVDQAEDVGTGAPTGSTLFGMYNVLSNQVGGIFSAVFPGLKMLNRAGVPQYICGFLGSMFAIVLVVDIISFLRGWGL